MNLLKNILVIAAALGLNSCANYISKMHNEFDRADGLEQPTQDPSKRDNFNMYRQNQKSSPIHTLNSENQPYVAPNIKRQYTTSTNIRKRYKASDLVDNQNTGSLWASEQAKDNYLFTENNEKSNGDIVLIKVTSKLKDDITTELKRAFPSPINSNTNQLEKNDTKTAGPAPASQTESSPEKGQAIYDRISSVVVEQINKDHLLLRGRKNVLYKNRKRVVEIQALISRRDIASDDTVISDRIIENNISVIR